MRKMGGETKNVQKKRAKKGKERRTCCRVRRAATAPAPFPGLLPLLLSSLIVVAEPEDTGEIAAIESVAPGVPNLAWGVGAVIMM